MIWSERNLPPGGKPEWARIALIGRNSKRNAILPLGDTEHQYAHPPIDGPTRGDTAAPLQNSIQEDQPDRRRSRVLSAVADVGISDSPNDISRFAPSAIAPLGIRRRKDASQLQEVQEPVALEMGDNGAVRGVAAVRVLHRSRIRKKRFSRHHATALELSTALEWGGWKLN